MRNLKKVLSLALALVMLLGMMVIGAGATSFKDDKDIKNQEAAAVVSTIKVLKGDETGNFNPDATLDRASAAMVIAKLDLGVDAAEALKSSGMSPFTDVPASHWAAGVIEYCASQDYIVGSGGKFMPSDPVTGVQFGIMLAKVLGYNGEAEGLGGADWAVKGASLARKAGLVNGVTAGTSPMTRDDMAQMTFNALTAITVEYEGLNISINGVTMTSKAKARTHSADKAGSTKVTTYDEQTITGATTPIRLCEDKFPNLKLSTTEDSFGRVQSVWKWKSVAIKETKTNVGADYTFTKKLDNDSQVTAQIGSKTAGKSTAQTWKNGFKSTGAITATNIKDLTRNGRLVEVYLKADNKTEIEKVVVIDTAVGVVTKVDDKNEKITIKLETSPISTGTVTTDVGYGEVKKDDVVLVQGSNDEADTKITKDSSIESVVLADSVSGTSVRKNVAKNTLSMDGTTYAVSVGSVADMVADLNLDTQKEATLYLDNYNNVIKVTAEQTVVGNKLIAVSKKYQTLEDGILVNMVRGVTSDGKTVDLKITSTSAGSLTLSNTTALQRYSGPNSDGEYALTQAGNSDVDTANEVAEHRYVATDSSSSSFSTSDTRGKDDGAPYYYAADVRFIFANGSTVTVLEGKQNFTVSTKKVAYALNSKDEIVAVFVQDAATGVSGAEVIYINGTKGDEIKKDDANGKQVTYWEYDAYLNGEKIDGFYSKANNGESGFVLKYVDSNGAYNVYDGSNAPTSGTVMSTAVGGTNGKNVVTVGGIDYIVTGDTVFTDLVKSGISDLDGIAQALAAGESVNVALVYDSNKIASVIYITKAGGGAKKVPSASISDANSVKALDDGVYELAAAPSDLPDYGTPAEVRTFKFTLPNITTENSDLVVLTIKNSGGTPVYKEVCEAINATTAGAVGSTTGAKTWAGGTGHLFYVNVVQGTGNTAQNGTNKDSTGIAEVNTIGAGLNGDYTYTVEFMEAATSGTAGTYKPAVTLSSGSFNVSAD